MPRFILISRPGGYIFGDTGYPFGRKHPGEKGLAPIKAARLIETTICDHGIYDYFETARSDPRAVYDVFLAEPDYPEVLLPRASALPAAVERDCKYVTTLAQKTIICAICRGGPLEPEMWEHGHNAEPVKKGRCCTQCFCSVVLPAQVKAKRLSQADADYRCEMMTRKPSEG